MKYDEHEIVNLSNKSREFIFEKAVAMENPDFSTISYKYQLKTVKLTIPALHYFTLQQNDQ